MKNLKCLLPKILLAVVIVSSSISCTKEDDTATVLLKTHEATNITANSATLEGEILSDGGLTITKRGVCVSTVQNTTMVYGHIVSMGSNPRFTVEATNLKPNTVFYYRAFAVTSMGVFYGEEYSLGSTTSAPIVETLPATNITSTKATCNGNVVNNGGLQITARGIVWATHNMPDFDDNHIPAGTGLGTFLGAITGLNPLEKYYFRAYATNSLGTSFGDVMEFYTTDWKLSQINNTWASARRYAVAFAVGDIGYFGTGDSGGGYTVSDFYKYNPYTGSWETTGYFAYNTAYAIGFNIGEKGYVVSSDWNQLYIYEFDPVDIVWTQRAAYNGSLINNGAGFSVGEKGYIVTGSSSWDGSNYGYSDQLWEYCQVTNTWTQRANFPGTGRIGSVAFSIGNKGYVGTGNYAVDSEQFYLNDFWEYDPELNTWQQKQDFGGLARSFAVGFSVKGKGYIATGFDPEVSVMDIWEYDPVDDTWTLRNAGNSDFQRWGAVAFVIADTAYIGTGFRGSSPFNDFWKFYLD